MSPLNVAICTTIGYTLWVEWYYLKKYLFDLEVKGQGLTKVITVRDTPPYGHAPTYQISLTSRKKQLFDHEVKGHYGMRRTALWLCTHIPNTIDLSRKTKMLWPGQENTI